VLGYDSTKQLNAAMGEALAVYQAHGKLMLFGEYVVMRGLPAIAFPIQFGQHLTVATADFWQWDSFENNQLWFSLRFNEYLQILETNNSEIAEKLLSILSDLKTQHPDKFLAPKHFKVQSNFNRNWGFGSSATLISLLAQWSEVDAYQLNDRHFGGSGYDIACAVAQGPIWYDRETRMVRELPLPLAITEKMLFVYLGKKQNSQQEVLKFSNISIPPEKLEELNDCLSKISEVENIEVFEEIVNTHEALLSEILQRPTLKSVQFEDYDYAIKSLGAWGGDFFLATCRNVDEARMYFIEKGFEVSFTYNMLKV